MCVCVYGGVTVNSCEVGGGGFRPHDNTSLLVDVSLCVGELIEVGHKMERVRHDATTNLKIILYVCDRAFERGRDGGEPRRPARVGGWMDGGL